jgi:hypothetical protein
MYVQVRVFAIDFARRQMACRGDLLGQQAHFVNQCIRHILQDYLQVRRSKVDCALRARHADLLDSLSSR